jgi:CHAT domain-containing protein
LIERHCAPVPKDLKPVLTVADPVYPTAPRLQVATRGDSALNAITIGSRYRGARGALTPLPNSATESSWVKKAFNNAGVAVGKLEKEDANKAKVVYNLPGRKIIHFACHGLVDQSYGNLFGSLALSPGPKADTDPTDDGFLTLEEIYQLDLKSCELAILSACETNCGPDQQGEGVWTLSRGFLVAGARRVVASNWLVDDEAAANLISAFCTRLANAEKDGKTVDYAKSLHEAKRWVRKQQKWKSPFYWGTFVLIGPS